MGKILLIKLLKDKYVNSQWNIRTISENFIQIESELNLLNQHSELSIIWERIRLSTFIEICKSLDLYDEPHQVKKLKKISIRDQAVVYCKMLLNILFRNPYFSLKRPKYLFFGHPRRKKIGSNTFYSDIYTDFFVNQLPKKQYIVIENLYKLGHFAPTDTKNLFYGDFFKVVSNIMRKVLKNKFSKLESQSSIKINVVELKFKEIFDVNISLLPKAKETKLNYWVETKLYDYLIKWLKPELLFVVVAYGKENLIQAAKKNNIKTIELQHGIISSHHMGYNFPENNKECSPDFLFSFGDYWNRCTNLPIEKGNVITIGYPYFSEITQNYISTKKKEQVIFISQGTISKKLSQIAMKLAKNNHKVKVIYKLHPGEIDNWAKRSNELYQASLDGILEVVDSSDISLYQLLAESKYQIGVYSTAIFEGLALNCMTGIINLPGYEYMQDLIESKIVKLFDVEDSIELSVLSDLEKINKASIFSRDWKQNFHNAMLRLNEKKA